MKTVKMHVKTRNNAGCQTIEVADKVTDDKATLTLTYNGYEYEIGDRAEGRWVSKSYTLTDGRSLYLLVDDVDGTTA